MENNRGSLKTGEKRMRRCGNFSVKLSSFILMSLLALNFWMVPVSAEKGGEFGMDFLKAEVDSERLTFEPQLYADYETDSEEKNKGSAENFDSIAQPSIKDVFTLLKNIQMELAALSNKTSEETQELKSEMADVYNQILDLETGIGEVNQTAAKILKGQSQMKQKIGANHDEVKKEFTNLSKELKSQMTSLSSQQAKQQKDEPKSQPTPKPTTSGKDKPKETVVTRSPTVIIHVDAPKPTPKPTSKPTPSVLTAPQFYKFEKFGGSPFTPPSDWKTKCVDLPFEFSGSLKTGGHCLFVCPEKNCQPERLVHFKTECQKINPNSKEIGKLRDIGINMKIKSFRQC